MNGKNDTCEMTVPTKVWPDTRGPGLTGFTAEGINRCGRPAIARIQHGEMTLAVCTMHFIKRMEVPTTGVWDPISDTITTENPGS